MINDIFSPEMLKENIMMCLKGALHEIELFHWCSAANNEMGFRILELEYMPYEDILRKIVSVIWECSWKGIERNVIHPMLERILDVLEGSLDETYHWSFRMPDGRFGNGERMSSLRAYMPEMERLSDIVDKMQLSEALNDDDAVFLSGLAPISKPIKTVVELVYDQVVRMLAQSYDIKENKFYESPEFYPPELDEDSRTIIIARLKNLVDFYFCKERILLTTSFIAGKPYISIAI